MGFIQSLKTYIFWRTWAITTPPVKSSTVLHGASTPNVWICVMNRQTETHGKDKMLPNQEMLLIATAEFDLFYTLFFFMSTEKTQISVKIQLREC